MVKDIFGKALLDFQAGNYKEDITTYSSLDEEDTIPLSHLFRNYENMPKIEQVALESCRGKVLDIGCGAGSHSLHLQQKGIDITALDVSEGAIEVCKMRGIEQRVHSDIMDYSGDKFDTLLLLMNGIGIVGDISRLSSFLKHARDLLNANGHILLDSSDIIYMFETENGDYNLPDTEDYYGEVKFIMEYQNKKSAEFSWLYIDFDTLQSVAEKANYDCKLLFEGEHYDYLAKLLPKNNSGHGSCVIG